MIRKSVPLTPAMALLLLPFFLFASPAFSADLPLTDKLDDVLKSAKPAGAKLIFLNVWGQTCFNCLLEMPAIVKSVELLKNNPDVAFVGLCTPDDDPKKNAAIAPACSAIAQKKQLNYPNFIWSADVETFLNKFNSTATPLNLLMTPDGKVVATLEIPLEKDKKEKAVEYIQDEIKKALSALPGAAKTDVKPGN